jgi:hypothetical protein
VLLAEREDLGELRARADVGDWHAIEPLAMLGDLDGLRAWGDANDWRAAWWLAKALAKRGDLKRPSRSCATWPTSATGTPPS